MLTSSKFTHFDSHHDMMLVAKIDLDITAKLEEEQLKKSQVKRMMVLSSYGTINQNVIDKVTVLYKTFGWELKVRRGSFQLTSV